MATEYGVAIGGEGGGGEAGGEGGDGEGGGGEGADERRDSRPIGEGGRFQRT